MIHEVVHKIKFRGCVRKSSFLCRFSYTECRSFVNMFYEEEEKEVAYIQYKWGRIWYNFQAYIILDLTLYGIPGLIQRSKTIFLTRFKKIWICYWIFLDAKLWNIFFFFISFRYAMVKKRIRERMFDLRVRLWRKTKVTHQCIIRICWESSTTTHITQTGALIIMICYHLLFSGS